MGWGGYTGTEFHTFSFNKALKQLNKRITLFYFIKNGLINEYLRLKQHFLFNILLFCLKKKRSNEEPKLIDGLNFHQF